MKKHTWIPLSLLGLVILAGCSFNASSSANNGLDYDYNSKITIEDPASIDVNEATGDFVIASSDGTYIKSGNIYTINSAGTYSLSGKLEGQILIAAGDEDDVVLELNGVSISYSEDAPIKASSGNKLEISAKKDSGNIISDTRSHKSVENDALGEGAISSSIDLKLKGSGTLIVTGNYNHGVYTSKDLEIQKLTLKSTGYNNAIKGKDSVTISSGTIQAYALTGNGIKTEDSDLSSKGNQRGNININGGSIYVDALHDGIDAAYDVVIDQNDEAVSTSISIVTGTNSSAYNKSSFKADSEKGIKASNAIEVNAGTLVISASDDAIHANYGDTLGNGNKGQGNLTINGGEVKIASGDDGLHADNTLAINGGVVIVSNATEGFEGNYINNTGGYSYIYGSDDGVNCSKKTFSSCAFTMSGGYLDVAVRSGDTDGIDSNGNFTLSGGTIVTRGSPGSTGSGMSTGLDVDGTASMTGGTLIAFNGLEKQPSTSSGINYAGTSGANSSSGGGRPGGWRAYSTSSSLSAGNYTLSGNGLEISFTNDYVYGSFLVYSSYLTSGSSYTLTRDGSTVYS